MTVKRIRPLRPTAFPFAPYGDVPPEGARVEWPGPQSYWARRVLDGSVEVVEDEQAPAVRTPKKKEA